ncbi:antirestriction protein ArdA [Marinomonas sp. TI.3.20]|uniref:antirestriction protein ArdA n=1 Tax=Marinomonas sp. TI.3.20 TaxID=3121296 RepID=UPI00311E9D42
MFFTITTLGSNPFSLQIDPTTFSAFSDCLKFIKEQTLAHSTERSSLEYCVTDWEGIPAKLIENGAGDSLWTYIDALENSFNSDVVKSAVMSDINLSMINEAYVGMFRDHEELGIMLASERLNFDEVDDDFELYFDFEKYGRSIFINEMRQNNGHYFLSMYSI